MDESGALQRLEEAMDQARQDLGIKWIDVAARADISLQTLNRFRKGGPRTPDTTRKIELVFGWPRGYVEAVVSGRPLPEVEPLAAEPESAAASRRDEYMELMREMDVKIDELRELQRRAAALGQKREAG